MVPALGRSPVARGSKLGVEAVQVLGAEVLQADASETGQDVVLQIPAVARHGGWPTSLDRLERAQPTLHVVAVPPRRLAQPARRARWREVNERSTAPVTTARARFADLEALHGPRPVQQNARPIKRLTARLLPDIRRLRWHAGLSFCRRRRTDLEVRSAVAARVPALPVGLVVCSTWPRAHLSHVPYGP